MFSLQKLSKSILLSDIELTSAWCQCKSMTPHVHAVSPTHRSHGTNSSLCHSDKTSTVRSLPARMTLHCLFTELHSIPSKNVYINLICLNNFLSCLTANIILFLLLKSCLIGWIYF